MTTPFVPPTDWPSPGDDDPTRDTIQSDCPSINDLWFCTRDADHAMPHIAGTGQRVVAVWDNDGHLIEVEAQ